MYRVVSTQPMSLREIAGPTREWFVDLDDVHLAEQSIELIDRRS